MGQDFLQSLWSGVRRTHGAPPTMRRPAVSLQLMLPGSSKSPGFGQASPRNKVLKSAFLIVLPIRTHVNNQLHANMVHFANVWPRACTPPLPIVQLREAAAPMHV